MAPISIPLTLSLLIIFTTISKSTSAPSFLYNFCSNTTTYSPNNTLFPSNLNTLFNSLSSNAATNPTGFHSASAGNATTNDAAYGLFLCRGDQNTSACATCVATAIRDNPRTATCPRSKWGIIFYDECMVRYSNETFLNTMTQTPRLFLFNTQNVTGNQTRFGELLGDAMSGLAVQTANENRSSGRKFGTREVRFTSLQDIYMMVQCTPDLTDGDCSRCLSIAVGQLLVRQGGRVLMPSCNIRYEIYPFLDVPFDSPSPPPLAVSPPPRRSDNSSGTGPETGSSGNSNISAGKIIAIVVPVAAVSLAVLAVCICIIRKKAKKYDAVAAETAGEDFTTAESLQYDLATLQSATNNFSDENKLGEGGFGGVYNGRLTNGQEIAVKRLSRSSSQGAQEFKNEVLLVAKLQHRNLVRLLGYCLARDEKMLVYEYVPNKSLDYFLYDPEKQVELDWGRRYKIIAGIARGMLYLHQDSRLRIIHRDLKASNILLDSDMNPKISDFGMARIFGVDQTQGNTSRVVGTYGYMSPEYAMHGQFSVKSDVYSFGVLVLEIVSGKRNSTFYESGYAEDLVSYAWKQWKDGMSLEFVDPAIRESCSSHEVMRCIHLGLLCVQESVDERPTMGTIVLMLDSYSVTLPVPQQPAFFIKTKEERSSKESGSDQSSSKSVHWSVNEASITELEPR